jgi:hypothetical protein
MSFPNFQNRYLINRISSVFILTIQEQMKTFSTQQMRPTNQDKVKEEVPSQSGPYAHCCSDFSKTKEARFFDYLDRWFFDESTPESSRRFIVEFMARLCFKD